ncbi:MAG TPA: fibronectin type III domain-containing protein, partial [Blastocatellia bacterium]|nr:fibronectin type III domain-containing protein [Blastocatellia bacterium]
MPTPPVHIMEQTGQLQGMQRGSRVIIWWPPPSMAAKPESKYFVDRVDIYKLIEHRDQEPTVDPSDYLDAAELVKFYSRTEIERQAREKGRIEFLDTLDLGGNQRLVSDTRLRYAIRYVNKYGQDALFSNSVEIDPNPAVALPPTNLHISGEAQDRLTLSWDIPTGNVSGQVPANVVGYNIYRRTIGSEREAAPDTAAAGQPAKAKKQAAMSTRPPEFELLNREPLIEPVFTDVRFKYLTDYEYMVRALSAGTSGLIESEDSIIEPYTP